MAKREEFDNNVFVKDVVSDMVNDPSEEKMIHVIAELIIRVNDEGEVPMAMMNELHIAWGFSPDIETEEVFSGDEEIGNRMVVVVTDDGSQWIPLYTSRDEIQDIPYSNDIRNVPIRTLLEKACDVEDIDGILINPHTDSLALRKPALELILDHADGELRHAC